MSLPSVPHGLPFPTVPKREVPFPLPRPLQMPLLIVPRMLLVRAPQRLLQRKVQRKAGRAVGVGWGGGVGQKRQACGILPIQQVVHTLHLRKGYGPVHAPLHPPLQGHLL